MINLYQQQQQIYCVIDLHANKLYACVVDSDGKKRLHQNHHTRDTDTFIDGSRKISMGIFES
jgi:predicted NBD/HSP70 family sugar kinase